MTPADKIVFEGKNYFKVPLAQLKHDRIIDFPLYVHMVINKSMVLRFTPSSVPSEAELAGYATKGLKHFACPEEFLPNFQAYLKASDTKLTNSDDKTFEQMKSTITSGNLSGEEKKQAMLTIGHKMLGVLCDLATADHAQKEKALKECHSVTDAIVRIGLQSHEKKSVYEDLLLLTGPDIEHASSVSTIAVIFALTLGFVDEKDLADIAIAGALHDVGEGLLPPQIFDKPYTNFDASDTALFHQHAMEGAQLLQDFGDDVPPIARQVALEHHERFDGAGFPKKLRGFQIDERVQIILLADMVSDLTRGRYDGKRQTPAEAFAYIRAKQLDGKEQYVNFALFEAILQVVNRTKPLDKLEVAS